MKPATEVLIAQCLCDIDAPPNVDMRLVWERLIAPHRGSSLELQVEKDATLSPTFDMPEIDVGRGFLGVHQPTSKADVVSVNQTTSEQAYRLAVMV